MLKIKKFYKSIFILLYLLTGFHLPAQSTGQSIFGDSTAAKSAEAEAATSQKKITVVGLGVSPDAAEKQAITDAVRQAVGAYIDSDTLVQNEEVIKDRILTVSNGFVKEYKVIAPARKRDDGLFEIQIVAKVEINQLLAALKSTSLIHADLDGQNIWAEGVTKLQNANDSVALLQAKMPEYIRKLVKTKFYDSKGQPIDSKEPALKTPNGEAFILTWYVGFSVDREAYLKHFAPILVKCMQNITNSKGVKFELKNPAISELEKHGGLSDFLGQIPWTLKYRRFEPPEEFRAWDDTLFIVEKATRNLDYLEGTMFLKNEYQNYLKIKNETGFSIAIELISEQGDLIAKGKSEIRAPFSLANTDDYGVKYCLSGVGPYFYTEVNSCSVIAADPIYPVTVNIPIKDMKDVKKIECRLEVPDFEFSIEPVKK